MAISPYEIRSVDAGLDRCCGDAEHSGLSMIFSENRYPFFAIMLYTWRHHRMNARG
jgi:hypothetical protein